MSFLDKLIDDVIDLPGKVVEGTVETVLRVPEAGGKCVSGALDGVIRALEKASKSLEDD
jgi:hypothetical protein